MSEFEGSQPASSTQDLSLLFHLNSEPWLNEEAYDAAANHEQLVVPGARRVVDLPAAPESPLTELQRRRSSCRAYASRDLSVAELAAVLAGTQGIVGATPESFRRRATPSAGGLFPLDTYVFARRINGLDEGLYRYDALAHAVLEIDRDDVTARLRAGLYAYPFIVDANAVVAFAARFARTQDKYGPRGYRYLLLEAGHCAQNLTLRATELGLATLCIGGFADSVVNAMLNVDQRRGGVLYMVAVGHPRTTDAE